MRPSPTREYYAFKGLSGFVELLSVIASVNESSDYFGGSDALLVGMRGKMGFLSSYRSPVTTRKYSGKTWTMFRYVKDRYVDFLGL